MAQNHEPVFQTFRTFSATLLLDVQPHFVEEMMEKYRRDMASEAMSRVFSDTKAPVVNLRVLWCWNELMSDTERGAGMSSALMLLGPGFPALDTLEMIAERSRQNHICHPAGGVIDYRSLRAYISVWLKEDE